MGLEKIIVSDIFSGKHSKCAGLYWAKSHKKSASIQIALYPVFHGKPFLLLFLPFIGKFLLSSVLYHEIGHHYHHFFKHGINRKNGEKFAKKYKNEMLKKTFCRWRIFLRPIAPLVKDIAKRHSGQQDKQEWRE